MRERLPSPGRPGTPALQSTRGHDSLQRLRVRPASFSQTSSAADVPTSPLVLPPLVGGMQQGVSDFGRASTGRGPLSSDAPPPSNRTVGIGGSEGVQKGDDEGQDGFFIGNNLFLAKGLTTAAALADEQLTGAAPSRLGPSGNGENNPLTLRRTLSCIEIDPFGKAQVRVYTREELIRELRSESVTGNTAVDVVELAFIRGDAREESQMSGALDLAPVTGGNRRTKSSKSKKRTKYGPIQSRDLRLLDPAFSVEPALHVRDHVILAVFDNHIRAAIQSHRLFIFDHESKRARRATEFVVQRLSRVSAEEAVPFEFVALEALLMATCADIEWMMRNVEPLIERELGVLSRDLRRSNLERLRVDERRLSLLLSRARNFEHLLEDILDEDEDMSHMYLTEMRYHPEKYRLPTDHEDVELLLENALQTVQSQVRRLELLDAGINNLEEILEIKLDISQNRIWSFNIFVHLCVATFFLAAIPADFFGMNLQIPPDKDPNVFWPWLLVFGLNMGLAVAFFSLAMLFLKRRRLLFGLFKRHPSD
jgi:magnesium transporter